MNFTRNFWRARVGMAVMGCAEPVLGCLNQRSRVWAFRGPVWKEYLHSSSRGPWSWWPGDPGISWTQVLPSGNNGPVLGNRGSQKPPPRSNGEHLTWSSCHCSWAPLRWQSAGTWIILWSPREYSWPLSLLMSFSPLMVQGPGPFSLFPQNKVQPLFLIIFWNNLCLPFHSLYPQHTHVLTAPHTHTLNTLWSQESDEWPSHRLPVVRNVWLPWFLPWGVQG